MFLKIVLIITNCFFVVGCFQNSVEKDFLENDKIVFHEVIKGEWQQMYIIPPYSTKEMINSQIGFKVYDSDPDVQSSDVITNLVFIRGKEVVKKISFSRAIFDFTEFQSMSPVAKEQSVFCIRQNKQYMNTCD